MMVFRLTLFASLLLTATAMAQDSDRQKNPGTTPRNEPTPWTPEEIETIREKGLIPLKLGNKWVHQRRIIDSDGTLLLEEEAISQIKGVQIFEGNLWYLIDEFGIGLWSRNTAEGNLDGITAYDQDAVMVKLTKSGAYFRFPAKLNETYDPQTGQDPITITVTALREKVKVPAGEFECVVYEVLDAESQKPGTRYFISPGVGIVKYEYPQISDDDPTTIIELQEFVPGDIQLN